MKKENSVEIRPLSQEAEDRIIKSLVEDAEFFTRMYGILDQNVFTETYKKWVVGTLKDVYKTSNYIPSYDGLLLMAQTRLGEVSCEEVTEYINDVLKVIPSTDREVYETEGTRFFRLKELVKACNETLTNAYSGELEKAEKTMNKLIERFALNSDALPESYRLGDAFDNIITNDVEMIPTGLKELDEAMGGGVKRQNLALWTAFRGMGKTTISMTLAIEIARSGYKVLFLNGEDSIQDLMRKGYAHLGNEYIDTFTPKGSNSISEETINKINNFTENYDQNLYVVKFPTGQWTVEDLENYMRFKISRDNFVPDVVVLDYLSCIKMSTNPTKNEWKAEGDAMRKLEVIAHKYNIVMHIMEQTKAMKAEDIKNSEGATTQGSISKEQICGYIFRLTRGKDKAPNKADLEINKVRGKGKGTMFEDFTFDCGRVQMDLSNNNVITTDKNLDYVYGEDN